MMRRKSILSFLRRRVQQALLISLLYQGNLLAQEPPQEPETVEVETEHTMNISSSSRSSKRSSDFENWIFAAASAVTAIVAIIIVSLSPGSSVPPSDQPL